jgi:hypothetical protein
MVVHYHRRRCRCFGSFLPRIRMRTASQLEAFARLAPATLPFPTFRYPRVAMWLLELSLELRVSLGLSLRPLLSPGNFRPHRPRRGQAMHPEEPREDAQAKRRREKRRTHR